MAVTGVNSYNSVYEDAFASARREVGKKKEARGAESPAISKANEGRLSSKAQEFLKNLRGRYEEYDFLVGNRADDLKALAKSGNKEFSVIFSNEELERMASDEKYAGEKLQGMEQAVKMSEKINEKYGFLRGFGKEGAASPEITRIGVVFGDNGATSFFAELEKSSVKQRERIEKAKEGNHTERRVEREMQSYGKNSADTKRTSVWADSMDGLLEKMLAVDWDAVKSEKMPGSGGRFDFSI